MRAGAGSGGKAGDGAQPHQLAHAKGIGGVELQLHLHHAIGGGAIDGIHLAHAHPQEAGALHWPSFTPRLITPPAVTAIAAASICLRAERRVSGIFKQADNTCADLTEPVQECHGRVVTGCEM